MKILLILRLLIGVLFVVSGGEKALGPYQNFLYVVQSYEIFPPMLAELIARTLPWIELFAGLFIVLGLWLKTALWTAWAMFLGFIIVVAQAMVRQLPIDECGCFGELLSFPLYGVLVFDSCAFLITSVLLRKIDVISILSLDRIFK
jgi:uncharacterized membrane protein YphA (DoxX/SURF4 family)